MVTKVFPYVSWGMWVARCPLCPNAEKRGRCDDGSGGGLYRETFTCRQDHGGCGFTGPVDWPDNADDIVRLLAVRPIVNRNWQPEETLDDLLADNILHGVGGV